MKYLKQALLILIITVVQTVICPYIKIGGIIPDLLFVYAVYHALNGKKLADAMIVASICGVVTDCFTGRIFGVYVSVYLVCAVCAFCFKETVFKNGIILNIIIFFALCIIGESLFYTMNIGVLKDAGYFYSLMKIILPEAFYNTLIFIIVSVIRKRMRKRKAGGF